jgi:hypothetical protein
MNDQFRAILDSLSEAKPRSRLGPYSDLVRELRKRRRPYREIARVLAEQCGLRVSLSTLHEFVQRHLPKERVSAENCLKPRAREMVAERIDAHGPANQDKVRQRIEALKRKATGSPNESTGFEFDASQPLRLRQEKS